MSAVLSDIGRPIGHVYNDLTDAEREVDATPLDTRYPAGHVWRYGADPTGATDSRAAIQAAIDVACVETLTVSRPQVYIPSGTYGIGDLAGADSYGNGLLIPLHSGSINSNPSLSLRIYGDGMSTRLLLAADGMIGIRGCRSFIDIDLLQIDGNGHTGCIGIALVPESMTQLTTLTNQSDCRIRRVALQHLTDGIKCQPGPDVLGSESGGFNHVIEDIYANFCNRAIWFAASATPGSTNRTTRTKIRGGTLERGNTAIHIEKGTEIDLHSVSMQLISSVYDLNCPDGAGVPLATPTAIRGEAGVSNIRLFGGYAEIGPPGTGKALVVSTAVADGPHWQNFGFEHNYVPDASEAIINSHLPGELVLARAFDGSGSTNGAQISFGVRGDNGLLFDPAGDSTKKITFLTNGASRGQIPPAQYADHADDASASAGGIAVGEWYRTGSILKVRVS